MAWGFDDVIVGGQAQVGTGIVPAIGQGKTKINGSFHCEGPMVFGGPIEFPDNFATTMMGEHGMMIRIALQQTNHYM